jgi:hypothetical protein
VRCGKPCLRWGMKITTRPLFAQGLKRRDPLHHHHPGQRCGRRVCLVYLYILVSMCTTPSELVRRIFNCNLGDLRW